MQRLVISDIHLGKRFEKNKFDYLKDLLSRYDEIIVNGDLWDHYSISFEDFVNSKWSGLFPLMKDKTIYIYGNHDRKRWSDKRANLFSRVQTDKHELVIDDNKYIFLHGHQISHLGVPENILFVKFNRLFRLNHLALMLDYFLTLITPNRYKKIEEYAIKLNNNEIIITGHKHIPVVDLEKKYAVTGCVLFGNSSYLSIDRRGKIMTHRDNY